MFLYVCLVGVGGVLVGGLTTVPFLSLWCLLSNPPGVWGGGGGDVFFTKFYLNGIAILHGHGPQPPRCSALLTPTPTHCNAHC